MLHDVVFELLDVVLKTTSYDSEIIIVNMNILSDKKYK